MKQLEKITVEDLCNRARDAGLRSGIEESPDFII